MTPALIGIIILGAAAVMFVGAVDENRCRAVIICLVIVILTAAASTQLA